MADFCAGARDSPMYKYKYQFLPLYLLWFISKQRKTTSFFFSEKRSGLRCFSTKVISFGSIWLNFPASVQSLPISLSKWKLIGPLLRPEGYLPHVGRQTEKRALLNRFSERFDEMNILVIVQRWIQKKTPI